MTVPVKYRGVGEGSIGSYSFTDLVQGLGYITFYASNNASFALLSAQQVASSIPMIVPSATTSTPLVVISSQDLDLNFNTQQIIGGADTFLATTVDRKFDGSGSREELAIDISCYRVDTSGSEHLLKQASGAIVYVANGVNASTRINEKITIPKTKIAIGEKVRFRVALLTDIHLSGGTASTKYWWMNGDSSGSSFYNEYQENSAGTLTKDLSYKNPTNLIIKLPFRIDL